MAAVLVTAAVLGTGPAASAADTARHPVVVIGLPGLRWDQVSAAATPTLWRLSQTSTVGSLSVRSADELTCPRDGWLSVSAGNRVRVPHCSDPDQVTTGPDGARVSGFDAVVRTNKRLDFDAVPGILVSSLAPTDCTAAVGREAALGAADRTGRVSYLSPAVDTHSLSRCPVTLVGTEQATPAAADALVARVVAAAPPGAVLLVVGLADLDAHDRAHLHVALAAGGPYGPGQLSSASTRRAPYVQLIDVAATVLALRGHRPVDAVDGQPWQRVGSRSPAPASLADNDRAAGAIRGALPWVVVTLVGCCVAASALALTGRRRMTALVSLVTLAGPVATFLLAAVPWWRAPAATGVLALGTVAVAGAVAVVAVRVGERRSWIVAVGAVAGLTFGVLALDLLTGGHLQLDSVFGYSPLVAGRFAGIGNVGFGVLGTSALMTATVLVAKRGGWYDAAAVGAVAVAIDGAPPWGSDVGGVLALVAGFAVLALLCRGAAATGRRLAGQAAAVVGGALLVVAAFALADYARPARDQTHLGRFVGRVLDGQAGSIVARKLHSNVDLLLANAATLLVPLLIVGSLWCVFRPRPRLSRLYLRHPEFRYGLTAIVVMALVGLVVNDSGVAIPAVAVLLGIPFVIAALTGDTPEEPRAEEAHVLP